MKSSTTTPKKSKKLLQRPVVRIAGLLLLTGAVCGAMLLPKSTAVQSYLAQRTMDAVIGDFADKVVIQTLEQATERLSALNTAVSTLKEQPSEPNLAEAAKAWRAARQQWQAIQSFAFGPCAFYDFDKQVASWPVDQPMIEHSIAQIGAGTLTVESQTMRRTINSTQRGLLTAEYLLFRDGQPRRASELKTAELIYLQAATQAMVEESIDFQAAWKGSTNLSANLVAQHKAARLPERSSYATEFTHPGTAESRYASRSVVLQEMFQESHTVVEDTCDFIEDWLNSPDPRASESQDSRSAVSDILALVQGVENAYLGGIEGKRGHGLHELVAAKDPVLDRRIQIALADLRHRVANVGDPYGAPAADRDLKLRIATASCWKLANKYAAAIVPVCMDPATDPWAAYGK